MQCGQEVRPSLMGDQSPHFHCSDMGYRVRMGAEQEGYGHG